MQPLMTSSSAADRPGSADPGTEPLPRIGARLAEPDGDTGPVRIVGQRPGPPPSSPSLRVTEQLPPVPEPPTTEQLPETERPPGRAGRNLGQAIGVGVGLGVVI